MNHSEQVLYVQLTHQTTKQLHINYIYALSTFIHYTEEQMKHTT